jgi:hypothetical protein
MPRQRATPYFESFEELRRTHFRLFDRDPAVVTRHFRIGETASRGTLLQTTVRLRADLPEAQTRRVLHQVFARLFRLQAREGFEVIVTFNAALTNAQRSSFSVFYGHDHSGGNGTGASRDMTFGEATIVNSMADVAHIPTSFDFEQLATRQRTSFEDSGVSVYKFLNVIFLIYTYVRI